ncbi:lipase family protein [Nocardia abscessus]|uniref:lipase family protein n=1 Tax=Nocardia abscessus TaxID=120957 RepID=UPI00245796D6|nr:lipase family protein [Nocardia abscessus]
MRPLLALTAACTVGIGAALTAAPAAAGPPVMMPAAIPDDFYSAPTNLAEYAPGDVLKVRGMPVPAGFLPMIEVRQIQYVSTDSLGQATPAVATIFSPPWRADNAPLMVFGHTVNALGLNCAPSRALWNLDPNLAIARALNVPLGMGMTVIVPDHLGPRSAYGAARLGGQITLDAIRAAQRHQALMVSSSPVSMVGYSGGGMAVAWAAVLASSYAPELPIVSAAIGGVPTNLQEIAWNLGMNAHPAFGLAMAAALGLEREYGDRLPITSRMTAEGLQLAVQMQNACTDQILALGAGRSVGSLATDLSLWDSPQTEAVLRANSLEFELEVPRVPIYAWHGADDPLIARDALARTLARWSGAGVPVTDVTVPGDHIAAAALGLPGAIQFLLANRS